jgi:predicted DNA-binding transcriptional regulator AlpA
MINAMPAAPLLQIEPAVLRKPDAARFMGVSETTFAAQVARKKYPASRLLADGSVGWLVSELRACAHALPVSDLMPVRRKAVPADQRAG